MEFILLGTHQHQHLPKVTQQSLDVKGLSVGQVCEVHDLGVNRWRSNNDSSLLVVSSSSSYCEVSIIHCHLMPGEHLWLHLSQVGWITVIPCSMTWPQTTCSGCKLWWMLLLECLLTLADTSSSSRRFIFASSTTKRIIFLIVVLAFNCIHDTGRVCFNDVCTPLADIHMHSSLQAANHGDLLVPSTETKIRDQSFSIAAPTILNLLPLHMLVQTLSKWQFWLGWTITHVLWVLFNSELTYLLTYL